MTAHCIAVPIPWSSGPVNTHLIEDDPLTLVDCGGPFASCMSALEADLATHGRRIEDLQSLVLTHNHIDHVGLASEIVQRSGAEVCAIECVVPWLAEYSARAELDDAYKDATMRRHGVPEPVIAASLESEPAFDMSNRAVTVDHVLREGDTLMFARRSWQVLHQPGHSPFDTMFFDERRGELFVGDHLISHVSSNALITPDEPLDVTRRRRSSSDYRRSLDRTSAPEVRVAFGGHGARIENPSGLIARRLKGIDRRSRAVADAVASGPCTAFEAAKRVFGPPAESEPFLVLSEVLGHVGELDSTHRITEHVWDGHVELIAA
jgi:glyoxylase-like metal-dependent hydrolase (beta-lactamase superfamily II)